MSTWSEQSWNEALERVMDRAAEDGEFRALCLRDAHAAVEAASGTPLPPSVNLRFSENEAAMVVRLAPLRESVELADEELEAVAGGLCITTSSWCVSSKCTNFCIAKSAFCF